MVIRQGKKVMETKEIEGFVPSTQEGLIILSRRGRWCLKQKGLHSGNTFVTTKKAMSNNKVPGLTT